MFFRKFYQFIGKVTEFILLYHFATLLNIITLKVHSHVYIEINKFDLQYIRTKRGVGLLDPPV